MSVHEIQYSIYNHRRVVFIVRLVSILLILFIKACISADTVGGKTGVTKL